MKDMYDFIMETPDAVREVIEKSKQNNEDCPAWDIPITSALSSIISVLSTNSIAYTAYTGIFINSSIGFIHDNAAE